MGSEEEREREEKRKEEEEREKQRRPGESEEEWKERLGEISERLVSGKTSFGHGGVRFVCGSFTGMYY